MNLIGIVLGDYFLIKKNSKTAPDIVELAQSEKSVGVLCFS